MTAKPPKSSVSRNTILCIDDQPKGPIAPGMGLRKVLSNTFKGSGYTLKYAENWKQTQKELKNNKQIGLVLLDYQLNFMIEGEKKQGPHIAKWLLLNWPEIKFIGLTQSDDVGNKIKYGQFDNNADYVIKKHLMEEKKRQYLSNITHAIIDDCKNKGWAITWQPAIGYLNVSKGEYSKGINIPGALVDGWCLSSVLTNALRKPGEWVGPFPSGMLTRAVNVINDKIRDESNGMMWGILTTEDAPSKCVMALVNTAPGGVAISYPPPPLKDPKPTKNGYWSADGAARLLVLESKFAALEQKLAVLDKDLKNLPGEFTREAKNFADLLKEEIVNTGMNRV